MIRKNSVVGLTYCLTNSEGQELDRAGADEPLSYLHGNGQIVPGLEKELEGLGIGDKRKVTVSPEEGYGEVVPELKVKAKRSNFPADLKIFPGQQFSAEAGAGHTQFFVVQEVEGDDVFLDGNHPLAGQTLHFDVEVVSVRDATKEELAHGHVHGEGGHHH
ncbi:peptidylprolyl isomerase [bacterium]|nr:peptidylprolyl isomerase [bacterium]